MTNIFKDSKKCPSCNEIKRYLDFGKDKSRKDLHSCYCKECNRKRFKEQENSSSFGSGASFGKDKKASAKLIRIREVGMYLSESLESFDERIALHNDKEFFRSSLNKIRRKHDSPTCLRIHEITKGADNRQYKTPAFLLICKKDTKSRKNSCY